MTSISLRIDLHLNVAHAVVLQAPLITVTMKTATDHVKSCTAIFRQYKELGEKAMAQVADEDLHRHPDEESNSIYVIIKHLHGNMKSRWTEFLTADGEKEWRDRDSEFEDSDNTGREQMMKLWEEGWQCVFSALTPLKEEDLKRIVRIRSEEHSVMEAINRQVAHYSYHIGQIVYLSKMLRSSAWQSLSIPRKGSRAFNERMGH